MSSATSCMGTNRVVFRIILGYNMGIKSNGGDYMSPIIKPSSELRKNYNSIADICRNEKAPVFLTKNGEGDTVIMDMETYSRREEDLAVAEHLLAVERARFSGVEDISVDDFETNMLDAIKRGAKRGA